ncbi:hypothetical protein [Kitasatospora aureofaciens]|uniref:hypothetical protein n=1 Tax=Kitasatospora aureofaciens TaxID=1894 RepID=UPI0033F3F190
MSVLHLLALAGAGMAGVATAAAAVLAPAARRAYRMTPRPVRRPPAVPAGPSQGWDSTDFFTCPREQARRPHAVSADGSRRCWSCGHHTPTGETR